MKRHYSFLSESVGRDLVGASSFSNRSTVVKQIISKYPTPQALAKALLEMAEATKDDKACAKIRELAEKCSKLDAMKYPAFVKKIAGLNKLWTIVGGTIAAAALTATTYWLAKKFSQAYQEDQKAVNMRKDDLDHRAKYEKELRGLLAKREKLMASTDANNSYDSQNNSADLDSLNNRINELNDQIGHQTIRLDNNPEKSLSNRLGTMLKRTGQLAKQDIKDVAKPYYNYGKKLGNTAIADIPSTIGKTASNKYEGLKDQVRKNHKLVRRPDMIGRFARMFANSGKPSIDTSNDIKIDIKDL